MKNTDTTTMKRIIILAILSAIPFLAGAQEKKEDWKERIMNEKIAFFTKEIQLTSEEAQAFWPVYNTLWEKMDKAHHKAWGSYRALSDALKDGKSENEIALLLDAYRNAIKERNDLEDTFYDEYRKVLPPVKVAKLYVAEERFRRQQIHKLNHQNKSR